MSRAEELAARARYMGEQYSHGAQYRGGVSREPHYLTQIADLLDRYAKLEAAARELVDLRDSIQRGSTVVYIDDTWTAVRAALAELEK